MKYFTYEEAQGAVPKVEKIISSALEVKRTIESKMDAYNRLARRAAADPAKLALERGQIEFLAQGLDEFLRAVEDLGAVLKGLDPALVDFPYRLDGKEVYLCWKYGEKTIDHYHGLQEGFEGRRPLPKRLLQR